MHAPADRSGGLVVNTEDPRLDWIRLYADGDADADTTRRLEAALRDDASLRQLFIDYLLVDQCLAASGVLAEPFTAGAVRLSEPGAARAASLPPSSVPLHLGAGARRAGPAAWLVGVAAAVTLVAAWLAARPTVTLARAVGAEFAGTALRGELVGQAAEVRAGLVELRFHHLDAAVVIEAPAAFRVEDSRTLRLDRGRATAHVRDGKSGLRVVSPHADVLDRGTRFAVDVHQASRSEVHVFEGLVEAGPAGERARQPLGTNRAVRFASLAIPESREVRSGAFVQPEEMQGLAAGERAGQAARAAGAEAGLRRDAALLGFVDFERPADDSAVTIRDPAVIVHGAEAVQGRFAGRRALEFVELDDHATLDLAATTRQLTLLTWVRLDRVPEDISSLYHTDGWDTPGQVHWMILNNGQMRFALHGSPLAGESDRKAWPESTGAVTGGLGRWTHLAAVYDADAASVTFYRDGVLDSSVTMMTGVPAVLGPAQIGNWDLKDAGSTVHRRLSGRMDDFMVLGRCLSAAEIRNLHAAGSPYR
jgi:hypothetical protein